MSIGIGATDDDSINGFKEDGSDNQVQISRAQDSNGSESKTVSGTEDKDNRSSEVEEKRQKIRVGFASRYFDSSNEVGIMVQGLLPALVESNNRLWGEYGPHLNPFCSDTSVSSLRTSLAARIICDDNSAGNLTTLRS